MTLPAIRLIAAPHTPMNSDASLNVDRVEDQAEHFLENQIAGVFVAGSTGESHSLTILERKQLVARWSDVASSTKLQVIVHVGHNCQPDAVELAAHASKLGVDAIAVAAPSYFKPANVADLISFCLPIAAAAPRTPFFFYDIPILTEVRLPMVDFLQQSKLQIPNLAGLKYTNPDLVQLQRCLTLDDGKFEILFGCDEILLAGYLFGARGAVGSTYNFAAPHSQRMIGAFEAGDHPLARKLQAQAIELIDVLRSFDFLPASKAVMRLLGIDCGPTRSPLRSLTDPEIDALAKKLESLEIWNSLVNPSKITN